MIFIRRKPSRPMSSGGTITSHAGHRPTHIRPFPRYGTGGRPAGGRGPPGAVTGHSRSACARGWAGPAVSAGATRAVDPTGDDALEVPFEQAARASARLEIRKAL